MSNTEKLCKHKIFSSLKFKYKIFNTEQLSNWRPPFKVAIIVAYVTYYDASIGTVRTASRAARRQLLVLEILLWRISIEW